MSHIYSTSLPVVHLPEELRLRFRDLDHLCRELVASASNRVTLVSPFWSPHGIAALSSSLAVAAERGALVRFVVDSGVSVESLRASLAGVADLQGGMTLLNQLRVMRGTDLFTFIHAKLILIDGIKGYLGSANFTAGGLERNFELGVRLDATQAGALEQLLGVFEAKGLLRDYTAEVFLR